MLTLNFPCRFGIGLFIFFVLMITGCGGGGGGSTGGGSSPAQYTVGGTVSGLSGTVVLQNGNSNNLINISANGQFTFPTTFSDRSSYAVTILSQPTAQTCSVANGTGIISGVNVTNVVVTCSTNTYTVGGVVSGLSGSAVLQNNRGNDLTVSANGAFTFSSAVADGSSYAVTVLTQPVGQNCSVANGTGVVASMNVVDVTVNCSTTSTLTVLPSGTGTGTVTSTPSGINCGATCSSSYTVNTPVTLTAVPSSGSIFEGFSGGCASILPSCNLTLTGNTTVSATLNTASTSAAGNQLGLNGGQQIVEHQQASNPPTSPLDLTTFSIEAWIYPLANQDMVIAADSSYYLEIKAQTATSPLGVVFAVSISNGYFSFPTPIFFAGNATSIKLNQWNHVIGMVDNTTKNLFVAINGELSGPTTFTGNVDTSWPQTFSVGNSYPSAPGNFPFIGRIDEVRLSSVVRYNANFAPSLVLAPDAYTVGLWHFDEAAGATSFADSSGNAYTLTGLSGAATIAGTRLDSTAGVVSDTTPPTVITTSPANGVSDISVNASLRATFSEEMLAWSVNTSSFTLKDGSNNPISGTVTYSGTTATFTPSSPLAYSTAYTAKVSTGSKDLAGNPMSSDYSWTFTTEAAIGSWLSTSTTGAPSGRMYHTAVWTGTEMIVWGGWDGSTQFGTGAKYNPATDTWQPISNVNAPLARYLHTAVWTGTEMIVWGGYNFDGTTTLQLNTGAKYNPSTDTWQAITTSGAPLGRANHTSVWTGTEMIVWGGYYNLKDGGRYNPVTDTWSATSTTNAPNARWYHTAVWSGTEMLVVADDWFNITYGGRFNPLTNTWNLFSNSAPIRTGHSAVWDGSEMIVWGGNDAVGLLNTGAVYSPSSDSWSVTSTIKVPSARAVHTAVWTGSEMIVWGGSGGTNLLSTGGRYNPTTDSWNATSITNVPLGRQDHTAVWTGTEMIIWGGTSGTNHLNTGGRYTP